jgi:hypothetical protein
MPRLVDVAGRPDRAPQPAPPTIAVQADRAAVARINPLLYGFGAGVSTSTYEPPVPGWASHLAAGVHQAGITALRFGGDHADDFDWQSSRLYAVSSSEHVGTLPGPYSGINTFLAFTRSNGLIPIIAVNAEIDDPQQAARLVEYTQTHGTPVTYWEIGNEPYLWSHFAVGLRERRADDQLRANPDQYAAVVTSYAAAMQAAASRHKPCLHVARCLHIIADEWITNATDQSWTSSVDIIDTHYFSFYDPTVAPDDASVAAGAFAAGGKLVPGGRLSLTGWLDDLQSSIAGFSGSQRLQVMVGSWGLDGGGGSPPPGDSYTDFAQALFTAQMLGQMMQRGAIIANAYPFYGEDQSLIDAQGSPRAGLYALEMYTRYFGRWLLESETNAAADAEQLWAVAGATAAGGGDVTLLVVNDDPNHDQAAAVTLGSAAGDGTWQPTADVWTLRHDVPDGTSQYGTTGLHHGTLRLTLSGGSFRYTFPRYSITLLRLHRR